MYETFHSEKFLVTVPLILKILSLNSIISPRNKKRIRVNF